MKRTFHIKSKLAGTLAAVMAISMAAPGIPAYASAYGDRSVIQFDSADGPSLQKSSYEGQLTDGSFIAEGRAGYLLEDHEKFSGIPIESRDGHSRPKLPEFSAAWQNHTFEGWYDEAGKKTDYLPYAFPYKGESLYHAVWEGSGTYKFKTMHYRDLNSARDNRADAAAWPEDEANDPQLWRFYDPADCTKDVVLNTPISATYRRDIPGYKLKSVLIKNNKARTYEEEEVEHTPGSIDDGGAYLSDATHSVRGNMPNDDLTVAYRYEPDPTKKFTVSVEYVDESGMTIKDSDIYRFSAEENLENQIIPPEIEAYELEGGQIKPGSEEAADLAGKGIYTAEDAGCDFGETGIHLKGCMPNQSFAITYTYHVNSSLQAQLRVRRVDKDGVSLEEDETRSINPNEVVEIDVPHIGGYKDDEHGFSWGDNFEGNEESYHSEEGKLVLQNKTLGGTVTIRYVEDMTDTDYWSTIEYCNGANGTISGIISPIVKKSGESYDINELTSTIQVQADSGYQFDGWYKADQNGNKKTGEQLEGDILVSGSVKLFANFEEDPNEWCDLAFEAGAHGSIIGKASIHTRKGTSWMALNRPAPAPEQYYMFDDWFDESGNRLQESQEILSSQHYTARFVPIAISDDGILAMPDVQGSIAADGSGEVSVSGANGDRRYALTDEDQTTLEVKTGMELENGSFTGLHPCTAYYVYELVMSADPPLGLNLPDHLGSADFGPPAKVAVPTLGDNYQTGMDTQEGRMQLIVNPAAQGALYAILDIDGNAVSVPEADEDGWLRGSLHDGRMKAVFGNLESNQPYFVVAKQAGEPASPPEKLSMGTQVSIIDNGQKEIDYAISLTNGGYIDEIIRNGRVVETEDHATSAKVKKGDKVKINAEEMNGNGQTFMRWEALIGSPRIADESRPNQPITIEEGHNIVLQAVYHPASTATPGNATIDYSKKDGKNALDLSEAERDRLIGQLSGNSEDQTAMEDGIDVAYTVKFTPGKPKASESNAVRAALEEDGDFVKIPWKLNSVLTRQVGGITKTVPSLADGGNPTPNIRVYSEIDQSLLGNLDYRLWKITHDAGTPECEPVNMTPDPNAGDGTFTGMVVFDATVGSTYLLSYCKAYDITILDTKKAGVYTFKVKSGTSLSDSDEFQSLNVFTDYTDPRTGVVYEYKGLGKTENASSEYDVAASVTKSVTLYVLYQQADDSEWQAAHKKLTDEIAVAQALSNNALVSEENRQLLKDAVAEALEVANRTYRPEAGELLQAYETLKAVVDAVVVGPDDHEWQAAHKKLVDEIAEARALHENAQVSKKNKQLLSDAISEALEVANRTSRPQVDELLQAYEALKKVVDAVKADSDDPDDPDNHDDSGSHGGGGSGGGTIKRGGGHGSTFNNYDTYNNGADGSWAAVGETGSQWAFVLTGGSRITGRWINVRDGGAQHTYHFDSEGIMDIGWYEDQEGHWYYLDPRQGTLQGSLQFGWFLDPQSARWHYLNQLTGGMLTGWQKLGDEWYFFNPTSQTEQPVGALFTAGKTPDGYSVDADGRWIRETP